MDDLMFWIIIGIILGGRLGYILFYMVPYQMDVLAADPLSIIRIWDGGMAFHGGILGVAIVLWWFAAKRGVKLLSVGDIAGVTAPIGIGLVRIANFTNAELYGRSTESSVGMVFPEGYVRGSTPPAYNWEASEWVYRGDEVARHPSQLYESVLEGWLPLIILSILVWKFGALKRPGLVAGLFLIMYGVGRSVAENFREPDAFVSGLPEWLTMGMILSVPMWLGGAWLIWNALKPQKKQV
jgi:phosphatidylglycerol:prolipoprotein diacylglycerol transferase